MNSGGVDLNEAVADLIEAYRIARPVLEELAGIEDSQGWTQNMSARVALYQLDGRL
jgi:rRNA-processing protein FCF1